MISLLVISTVIVLAVRDDPPSREDRASELEPARPAGGGAAAAMEESESPPAAPGVRPDPRPAPGASRAVAPAPAATAAPEPAPAAPPGPAVPAVAQANANLAAQKHTATEESRRASEATSRGERSTGHVAARDGVPLAVAAAGSKVAAPPPSRSSTDRDAGTTSAAGAGGNSGAARAPQKTAAATEAGRKWSGAERPPSDDDDIGLTRVARFVPNGGASLKGRVVEAEAGRPIAAAIVHVRLDDNYVEVETDAGGAFRIPGMLPSTRVTVWIVGRTDAYVAESIGVSIPGEGETADAGVVRLIRGNEMASHLEGWVGLFVTRRGRNNIVAAISPWLSADGAGIEVGDVLLSIDGHDTSDLGPRATSFLLRGPTGTKASIVAQGRDGQSRKVELTRVPR